MKVQANSQLLKKHTQNGFSKKMYDKVSQTRSSWASTTLQRRPPKTYQQVHNTPKLSHQCSSWNTQCQPHAQLEAFEHSVPQTLADRFHLAPTKPCYVATTICNHQQIQTNKSPISQPNKLQLFSHHKCNAIIQRKKTTFCFGEKKKKVNEIIDQKGNKKTLRLRMIKQCDQVETPTNNLEIQTNPSSKMESLTA